MILKDIPNGPLDDYRKLATFDWKSMKQVLYSQEAIQFERHIYEELAKYPILLKQHLETPNLDKLRQNTLGGMFCLISIENKFINELSSIGEKQFVFDFVMFGFDVVAMIKKITVFGMLSKCIRKLGTQKHERFLEQLQNIEIAGCFGLTEIGHGSNIKDMRTTATYDIKSKQFILNTPDFQAAKCWIAGLGKTATHMATFANLITPDGVNHGIHIFVVPVRDPRTLHQYPGAKLFDMGEKIGANGIDNGLVIFSNYGIPRDNLLNKLSDVTEDGKYKTNIENPNIRFALSLGELLTGRLTISCIATAILTKAITIGIRYAAIRRQFAPETGGNEIPILEYQSHQYRLLPYLASAYAFHIFCSTIYTALSNNNSFKSGSMHPTDLGEIHAIFSASKSITTWVARDGVQECREACGGHGYLKVAEIGELRADGDALLTGEGDNHVLLQQTSKWLIKHWPLVLKKQVIITPLDSITFLNNAEEILHTKPLLTCEEDVIKPKYILDTFKWLCCYLLKLNYNNLNSSEFQNENQIQMEILSSVYIQHFTLTLMFKKISLINDLKIKTVLLKLFSLYGLYNLQKHIPTLYSGEYATGANTVRFLQTSTIKLCEDLKYDAVALIDVIAPEDCALKSVLGQSDGKVYEHLEEAILNAPGASERPTWWKEIINSKKSSMSKL